MKTEGMYLTLVATDAGQLEARVEALKSQGYEAVRVVPVTGATAARATLVAVLKRASSG